MNTLQASVQYDGGNLETFRRNVPDAGSDFTHPDPPLNSNRDYNVIFGATDG